MPEITYLMDRDPAGAGYFTEAERYFSARADATVVTTPEGAPPTALADVLTDLRVRATSGDVFAVVNLVSHATGFSALQFPISQARREVDAGLITTDTLKRAVAQAGTPGFPPVLGPPAVTSATKVCLYGCDVGRDAGFMRLLGLLFGPELTIYAPLRMAVFRHQGSIAEHRLARTWSVPWPRDVRGSTDWAQVRTQFVDRALPRFTGRGDTGVEAAIRTAAQAATATSSGSFFFAGSVQTADNPATHPAEATSVALPAGTVDDTTVPLALSAADFAADPARPGTWVAWAAVLGQVLEQAVSLEDAGQFRRTVISGQRAPSTTPLVVDETEPTPVEEPMSELFGKYRGVVVDDSDPTDNGRLRVDVPAVAQTGVWAAACLPPVPTSLLELPPVGADVWVEFEAGDPTRPIWTGATWHTRPSGDVTLASEGTVTIQAGGDLLVTAGEACSVTAGMDFAAVAGLRARIESGSSLDLLAASQVKVQAAQVDLGTAHAQSSGVLQVGTLIANSVVSAAYTPGAGNLY